MNKKAASPKDHLANERTFLAWIRTSIALMGFGILIVKFAYMLVGIIMVALGAIMASLAYWRYRNIERQLDSNSFFPSKKMTALVTIAIIIGCIFLVIYLLPGSHAHAGTYPSTLQEATDVL